MIVVAGGTFGEVETVTAVRFIGAPSRTVALFGVLVDTNADDWVEGSSG